MNYALEVRLVDAFEAIGTGLGRIAFSLEVANAQGEERQKRQDQEWNEPYRRTGDEPKRRTGDEGGGDDL